MPAGIKLKFIRDLSENVMKLHMKLRMNEQEIKQEINQENKQENKQELIPDLTDLTNMTSQERAFSICIEMLQQRAYEIVDIDEENMHIVALKPNGEQMVVLFNTTPKFDSKSMKEVISFMSESNIAHSLVIYQDGITPATKSVVAQLDDMRIELFAEKNLQINITKHRLQPVFERLEVEEAKEFKEKYGTKFAALRVDKPISRFYDYSKGDVIRVTRNGGYITYRVVK